MLKLMPMNIYDVAAQQAAKLVQNEITNFSTENIQLFYHVDQVQ